MDGETEAQRRTLWQEIDAHAEGFKDCRVKGLFMKLQAGLGGLIGVVQNPKGSKGRETIATSDPTGQVT